MELTDIIKNRYSVRDYSNKNIEKTLLLEVLEAARLAPSAVNFQPWHFIVITENKLLSEIHECYQSSNHPV